jgi:hypothetical protein
MPTNNDHHLWQELILGDLLGSRHLTNLLLIVIIVMLLWWR